LKISIRIIPAITIASGIAKVVDLLFHHLLDMFFGVNCEIFYFDASFGSTASRVA
jgi:hypothetical protein